MASDSGSLRHEIEALRAQVGRAPESDLRSLYLRLVPLIGQLRGLVSARVSAGHAGADAAELIEAASVTARRVGLDIRLASPAAIRVGLLTALDQAGEALDALDQ